MKGICNTCNIEIDESNYLKDRTVCKKFFDENRRNNNNSNILIQNQQPTSDDQKKRKVVNSMNYTNNNKKKTKVVDSVKNNNNRTFIVRFSNCGKTYPMNHILFQKQEPVFIIAKSINQYPKIKAQTSDEIHPSEHYENSTVVFDDTLLSTQESNIDLFFIRGRPKNIDIYYTSQSYFLLPKITIRNNSNIFVLFKQTIRDIILLFHDIAVLDINLKEWKQLCRKAWENDYENLQIDRFAKIGEGSYTIRNCNKTTYLVCTPETKPF